MGDIVAIVGTPTQPLTVNISGVTVDGYDPAGRAVAVEAGILFLDAKGSVKRSHVTNVVTSEGDNAYTRAGGWRGEQPGIGIAQTSTAMLAPVDGARRLEIDRTRVDKYNRVGILIDGAQNDIAPFMAPARSTGASSRRARSSAARCASTTPAPAPATPRAWSQPARCSARTACASPPAPTPRSTARCSRRTWSRAPAPPCAAPTTNNANLNLAAGARFAGAKLTSYSTATGAVIHSFLTRSNIVDNAYGVLNLAADGTTTVTGNPNAGEFANNGNLLKAENNWWGVRNNGTLPVTPPPPISPTTNPPVPENPVNGTATAETATGGTTSNSVDYFPYRSGPQSDPITGAWPVLTAPMPIDDAIPTAAPERSRLGQAGRDDHAHRQGSDDFGIKRVRFADGATTLSIATLPPYTATATIPANATCNSTRTYCAIVMDSAGQTASASQAGRGRLLRGPTRPPRRRPRPRRPPRPPRRPRPRRRRPRRPRSPRPDPPTNTPTAPRPPSVSFIAWPTTISRASKVSFAPSAEAGLKQVELFLGTRQICVAPRRRSSAPSRPRAPMSAARPCGPSSPTTSAPG